MVVVIGGGGTVWAACQLDLQLSWVIGKAWVRKRQHVCEREKERGEGQQTSLIDLRHPSSHSTPVMCTADKEDRESESMKAIKFSLSNEWNVHSGGEA